MKLKKICAVALAAVMSCSLLAGCSSVDMNAVIAEADGIQMTASDYDLYYKMLKYQWVQQSGASSYDDIKDQEIMSGTTLDAFVRQMCDTYVTNEIAMRQLFAENGFTIDDATLDVEVEKSKAELGGEDTYQEMLKAYGITEEQYRKNVEYSYILDKLKDLAMDKTEAETQAKSELASDYARIKHILIKYVDDNNQKLEGDAYTEKENLYNEVKAKVDAGEDFDALIEEYGEDPGVTSNPDGYIFTKDDSYDEAFKTKAFELAVGEIGVAESSYGWHIMLRCPTDDDVTWNAKGEELTDTIRSEKLNSLISEQAAKNTVTLNKDITDKIK